jgi:hypothetical protein
MGQKWVWILGLDFGSGFWVKTWSKSRQKSPCLHPMSVKSSTFNPLLQPSTPPLREIMLNPDFRALKQVLESSFHENSTGFSITFSTKKAAPRYQRLWPIHGLAQSCRCPAAARPSEVSKPGAAGENQVDVYTFYTCYTCYLSDDIWMI